MGAVGCRCDNMTTAGVATELKWTRKFSENFIETDSSARAITKANPVAARQQSRRSAADRSNYRQAAGAFAASVRRRNLNFDLNCMRRI
jgi:hypothetical protein